MEKNASQPTAGSGAIELHSMEIYDEWVTCRSLARSLGVKPFEIVQRTGKGENEILPCEVIEAVMAEHGWKPIYDRACRNKWSPHQEKFLALMRELGLLREGTLESNDHVSVEATQDGSTTVTLHSGGGYPGFFAEFKFDPSGKFVSHGLWQ